MVDYKWNCAHCHENYYGEDSLDGPRGEGSTLKCRKCGQESEIVFYDVVYEYHVGPKCPIPVDVARAEVATRLRRG